MQPSYDSWDFESGDTSQFDASFGFPPAKDFGLTDTTKGKGNSGADWKDWGSTNDWGETNTVDYWDTWGPSDNHLDAVHRGPAQNGKGMCGSFGGKPPSSNGPYAPTLPGKGFHAAPEAAKGSTPEYGGPPSGGKVMPLGKGQDGGAPVAKVIPPRIVPAAQKIACGSTRLPACGGAAVLRPPLNTTITPAKGGYKGPPKGQGPCKGMHTMHQPRGASLVTAARMPAYKAGPKGGTYQGPSGTAILSAAIAAAAVAGGPGPRAPQAQTVQRPQYQPVPHVVRPRDSMAVPPRPLQALPAPAPASNLSPELQALVAAGADNTEGKALLADTQKPRIILLATRLAPDLQENHMQQILEQCGEVHAWRRGRGAAGEPLSFGFIQFGDPESAWKASTCLSKRVLCGHEIKILVEEGAQSVIKRWRDSQKAALRIASDDELDWELERKAVSCKALIDIKMEEIYGPPEDGSPGPCAQRRKELREREQTRIERVRKRRLWRRSEYARELEGVEHAEKRLRREEQEADDADRAEEEAEMREKVENELKSAKLDELGVGHTNLLSNVSLADSRAICETVDQVQLESRNNIFRMELDALFLRDEKILEQKLRPWLERKVDCFMGGPQCDLVEYILRRVNGASNPESLINDLTRYLDDSAEPVVERMWRMLVFEAVRSGKLSLEPPTRSK